MATYSAADIVDKSLIAKRAVPVFKLPEAKMSNRIGVVNKGNSVGIVYSYIQKPDGLYWMFKPKFGTTYYAKHIPGDFDVSNLRTQGVISQEEKAENERREELSWWERLKEDTAAGGAQFQKDIIKLGLIVIAVSLLPTIIRTVNAGSKMLLNAK
jgi:hypothetical protein